VNGVKSSVLILCTETKRWIQITQSFTGD